ncbi:MAG: MFS transporter [Burkholderiaceae bacterium]|nr:MFS transporter [Burkholderiaceae bacterium]
MHTAVLIFMLRENQLAASVYGMSMSATAAGYMLATLTIRRWMDGRELRVMTLCIADFCATILLQGVWSMSDSNIALLPLLAIWMASGYCFGGKMMCYIVLMQTHSPKDRVGLVMASSQSLMLLILQISPLIGVAITEFYSAGLTYFIAAMLGLVVMGWVYLGPEKFRIQMMS